MIVIEGIDKAGKSTFAKTLNKTILHYPLAHISTYLSQKSPAQALLKEMVISPPSDDVICDRYWPSTLVYQNIVDPADLLGACKILQCLLPISKIYYLYPKDFETWIHRMAQGDEVMVPTLQNYTDMVERYSRVMLACMAVGINVQSVAT